VVIAIGGVSFFARKVPILLATDRRRITVSSLRSGCLLGWIGCGWCGGSGGGGEGWWCGGSLGLETDFVLAGNGCTRGDGGATDESESDLKCV
jgi:hypothetical protein